MKLTQDSEEVRNMAMKFKFRTPTKAELRELSKIPASEKEKEIIKRIDEDGPLTFREAMIFCFGLLTYQMWSIDCLGEETEWLKTLKEVKEYCEELKAREGGPPIEVKIKTPSPEVFAGRIQIPGSLTYGFHFDQILRDYPLPWVKGDDAK